MSQNWPAALYNWRTLRSHSALWLCAAALHQSMWQWVTGRWWDPSTFSLGPPSLIAKIKNIREVIQRSFFSAVQTRILIQNPQSWWITRAMEAIPSRGASSDLILFPGNACGRQLEHVSSDVATCVLSLRGRNPPGEQQISRFHNRYSGTKDRQHHFQYKPFHYCEPFNAIFSS